MIWTEVYEVDVLNEVEVFSFNSLDWLYRHACILICMQYMYYHNKYDILINYH